MKFCQKMCFLICRQIDENYVKPVVKQIEEFLMDLKAETLQLEYVPIGKKLNIIQGNRY